MVNNKRISELRFYSDDVKRNGAALATTRLVYCLLRQLLQQGHKHLVLHCSFNTALLSLEVAFFGSSFCLEAAFVGLSFEHSHFQLGLASFILGLLLQDLHLYLMLALLLNAIKFTLLRLCLPVKSPLFFVMIARFNK